MLSDIFHILPLLAGVALGCYIQTITGFAFGLVFISFITVFNLLDLQSATLISSALAVVNTTTALLNRERHADKKLVLLILICGLPFLFVGYQLLAFLDANNITLIKYILSIIIILASLLLFVPPKQGKSISSLPVFGFFGGLAGLLGGLFAISGPPLIFQFYRQNLPVKTIRDCLLTIFIVLASTRLGLGVAVEGLSETVWTTVLLALPIAYGFTWLAKNFPPKISDLTLRRIAAILLIFSAITIAVQA
ncbi:TSUP family transporter [Terasakiella sp. A23]|uniref:TSUP family transporter n=1 Tax=Terasakiella sp. FCG-A23 TaxID=3080561 RepID=UPI0029547665|nr:TSUP family transporter [Terasakiella sp. A23]MDV7340614.1 TSUP family transporter [Terasakiella sp. A23]